MDIVLHDLYFAYIDIGIGSGAGQQLHDPYGAGRAALALIDAGFLIGQGGDHQPVKIILLPNSA